MVINRTPGRSPLPSWLIIAAGATAGVMWLVGGAAIATGLSDNAEPPPVPTSTSTSPTPVPTPTPAPTSTTAPASWQVRRVVDGDTVDFRRAGQNVTVRLGGIDAPETGKCGAKEATAFLTRLLTTTGSITLDTTGPGRDDKDKYGRLIRYVSLHSGHTGDVDAGYTMIKDGYAIARYDSRDGFGAHTKERSYIAADEASPPAAPCAKAAAKNADDEAKERVRRAAEAKHTAKFKYFSVTVTQLKDDEDDFPSAKAKVCVRALPPGSTGGKTRISLEPWAINGDTGKDKAWPGADSTTFPTAKRYKKGQCAAGWITFNSIDYTASDVGQIIYYNSLGNRAVWDAQNLAKKPKTSYVKPRPKAQPKPKPPSHHSPPSVQSGVHPGAFCSPEGALGETNRGTAMACTSKAGDRARWRAR